MACSIVLTVTSPLPKNGAAVGGYYIVGQGIDYRFAFEVDTLELIAMSRRSLTESGADYGTGVEAFAFHGKAFAKSELLHYDGFIFCSLIRGHR